MVVFLFLNGCFTKKGLVYDLLTKVPGTKPSMDISEFEKQVHPRSKRSRLDQFKAEIFELKNKGYTNGQVKEWLAKNELLVSIEAVRKFIKSRFDDIQKHKPDNAENNDVHTPIVSNKSSTSTQAEKMKKLVEDQKRDANSAVFKHDKTGKNT